MRGLLRATASVLVLGVGACAAAAPVVSTKVSSVCGSEGAEGPFSVSQAQHTMTEAAGAAGDCAGATTAMTGKAMVTFSPAGCAQQVVTTYPDGSLKADAVDCVAKAFLAAKVAAFQGQPVSVAKTFSITP